MLAFGAEAGSAWTLVYPRFSVVVPEGRVRKLPVAVAMPRDEPELHVWVDAWVETVRSNGTMERLYDYWILGRHEKPPPPRWSVARDVLGWLD